MTTNTGAVELARIILDDSEADPTAELYTLTVHEARTLARAVTAVANLADRQDREVYETFGRPIPSHVGHLIRAALKGDTP